MLPAAHPGFSPSSFSDLLCESFDLEERPPTLKQSDLSPLKAEMISKKKNSRRIVYNRNFILGNVLRNPLKGKVNFSSKLGKLLPIYNQKKERKKKKATFKFIFYVSLT